MDEQIRWFNENLNSSHVHGSNILAKLRNIKDGTLQMKN